MKFLFGMISFDRSKSRVINEIYNKILKLELKSKNYELKNHLQIDQKSTQLNLAIYSSNEINKTIKDGKNAMGIYSGLPYFDEKEKNTDLKLKELLNKLSSNKPVETWMDLGDFVAVFLDEKQHTINICRDPFGTLPIYFEKGDSWIAFSNNLRTLYKIRNKRRDYDKQAIGDFLALSYFLGPRTFFSTIQKLPAMHNCRITKGELDFRPIKYSILSEPKTDIKSAIKIIDKIVTKNIKKRMNFIKTPVFTLTGGLDTTGLTKKCLEQLDGNYNSIIGFAEGLPEEELELSRRAAELLNLEHHEAILKPKDVPKYIKQLAHKTSEPIGDTAAVTSELTAQKASELGDMVFAGNGGDENFVGYARYRWGLKYLGFKKKLPDSYNLKRRTSRKASDKYLGFLSTCPPEFIRKIIPDYSLDFSQEFTHKLFKDDKGELIKNYMWTDYHHHMIYDQLFLMDQTFQRYNLPCRYPFLDFDLFKIVFNIPAELSLTKTDARLIQKKWLSDIVRLPDKIVYRKKQGFGAPIDTWIETSLMDYSQKVIFKSKLITDNIFEEKELYNLLYEQPNIRKINSEIYYFTNMALWLDSLPEQIGDEL